MRVLCPTQCYTQVIVLLRNMPWAQGKVSVSLCFFSRLLVSSSFLESCVIMDNVCQEDTHTHISRDVHVSAPQAHKSQSIHKKILHILPNYLKVSRKGHTTQSRNWNHEILYFYYSNNAFTHTTHCKSWVVVVSREMLKFALNICTPK